MHMSLQRISNGAGVPPELETNRKWHLLGSRSGDDIPWPDRLARMLLLASLPERFSLDAVVADVPAMTENDPSSTIKRHSTRFIVGPKKIPDDESIRTAKLDYQLAQGRAASLEVQLFHTAEIGLRDVAGAVVEMSESALWSLFDTRSRCTTRGGALPSGDCEAVRWRSEYVDEFDNSMWLCSLSCYRPQTNVARRGTNGERIHE